MKVCPRCGARNEDQYLYCYKCNAPLPKMYKLESLKEKGRSELFRENFREALRPLKQLVSLNPGDKEAWMMLAIIYRKLKMHTDMIKAYDSAGIRYKNSTCATCGGTGICPDCGGDKICLMCNGKGRCHMCKGSGVCFVCHGEDSGSCRACAGTGKCPRCGGSGECVYCGGNGFCGTCGGDGLCPMCGGTRMELKVELASIPQQYRRFFQDTRYY